MSLIYLNDTAINCIQMPCQLANPLINPIVLIHGLAASAGFWHPSIVQSLARATKVTLYDLRGHGRSLIANSGYDPFTQANDLSQIMAHLQIEQAHLIGHSYGGAIALAFALQHPKRIRSLTLLDTRLRMLQPRILLQKFLPQTEGFEKNLIDNSSHSSEDGYQLLTVMAHQQMRLSASANSGLQVAKSPRAAQRWLDLQQQTAIQRDIQNPEGLRHQLRRLKIPILGIYGERSPTLLTGKRLQRRYSGFHLRILPNVGHFFPLTRPMKTLRLMIHFLAEQHQIPVRHLIRVVTP